MIHEHTRSATTYCVAILALSLTDLLTPFQAPSTREAKRGLAAYEAGDYAEASDRFLAAQDATSAPDATLIYDLGTAAYREGESAAAVQNLARVAGEPGSLGEQAAYNLGNALYRGGKLDAALQAYREALRRDPNDEDARFNYELTLSKLQQQKNQQKNQNQKQNQDQKQGQNEDQQGQDQKQNQDQEKNQAQNQEQNQTGQPDERKEDSQQQADTDQEQKQKEPQQEQAEQQQQGTPGENGEPPPRDVRLLTPEQAIQLLNAVTPEERELLEARLRSSRQRRVEKDW